MPVEELDVVVEVLVEIAAGHERPADGAHGVDGKRQHEENDGAERPLGEPLEPGERTREPGSRRGSHPGRGSYELRAAVWIAAGVRKRWMSCCPSSAAGRNATTSNSRASLLCT